MRSLAHRHPIGTFLAFVYSATALIFAVPFLSKAGIGVIDLELPGAAPFILLSALSLVVSAFVATALADGRSGVRDLRKRVFHFRVRPTWYPIALFALPAVALVTAALVSGGAPLAAIAADPAILVGVVLGAIVAFALVNWWEEAAWTGFALERLQPRVGPLKASVVTTWMQATMHLPLVFIAGGVTGFLAESWFTGLPGGGPTQSPSLKTPPEINIPFIADPMNTLEAKHWFLISDFASVVEMFTKNLSVLTILGLVLIFGSIWALWHTRFGLRLRSCGEAPAAAESLGVSSRVGWRISGRNCCASA